MNNTIINITLINNSLINITKDDETNGENNLGVWILLSFMVFCFVLVLIFSFSMICDNLINTFFYHECCRLCYCRCKEFGCKQCELDLLCLSDECYCFCYNHKYYCPIIIVDDCNRRSNNHNNTIYPSSDSEDSEDYFEQNSVVNQTNFSTIQKYEEDYKNYETKIMFSTFNQESCPICLESLEDETCVELKCNHIFHKKCFEGIINNCPLCREPLQIKYTCETVLNI